MKAIPAREQTPPAPQGVGALALPDPTPEPHQAGTALVFPRDEGWHAVLPGGLADPRLSRMEWVYANCHLTDDEGFHVVVFVAYFTQGLRLLTVRRFDPEWRLVSEHLGTSMGLLRPSTERFDLRYRHPHGRDTWQGLKDASGQPIAHASRLEVEHGDLRLELDLSSRKAPYHAGDPGFLPFSDRGWFFYYSLTRMAAEGVLTVGKERKKSRLVGQAWLDHQWGPFYVTPFRNPRRYEQYEWFSLQLSSGAEIVLTTVWTPSGDLPSREAFGGAGLVRPDGTTARLVGAERLTRTHFHRDPKTASVYSAGWRFVAPEWGCDLTVRPRHPHQMTPMGQQWPEGSRFGFAQPLSALVDLAGAFWEGTCEVHGRLEGALVTGDAFAELVKRYSAPRLRLEVPIVRDEAPHVPVIVLRWRVVNWDAAVPIAYRVRVFGRAGALVAETDDLDISVFCFDLTSAQDELEVVVTAHSPDFVLRSEARGTLGLPRRGKAVRGERSIRWLSKES